MLSIRGDNRLPSKMSSRSRRSRRNSGGERTGQSQRDQAAAEVPIISGIYFLQMGGSEAREREIRNTTRNKERDGGREGRDCQCHENRHK